MTEIEREHHIGNQPMTSTTNTKVTTEDTTTTKRNPIKTGTALVRGTDMTDTDHHHETETDLQHLAQDQYHSAIDEKTTDVQTITGIGTGLVTTAPSTPSICTNANSVKPNTDGTIYVKHTREI
jgi:hypothetical protein